MSKRAARVAGSVIQTLKARGPDNFDIAYSHIISDYSKGALMSDFKKLMRKFNFRVKNPIITDHQMGQFTVNATITGTKPREGWRRRVEIAGTGITGIQYRHS